MSIEIRNVSKQFGDFHALRRRHLDVAVGRAGRAARPLGLRQDDAAAHHRRAGDGRTPAASCFDGEDATDAPRARAPGRLRVPALRAVPHMTVFENVAFGLRVQAARASGRARQQIRPRCTSCWSWCSSTGWPTAIRSQLSGGQRQRIALARALAVEPQGAAARRAVRRARRQGAQGAAPLAAPPARRAARHQHLRHPRPGRGARSGRPRGADEQAAASSRSARRRRSTTIRPAPSSTASSATSTCSTAACTRARSQRRGVRFDAPEHGGARRRQGTRPTCGRTTSRSSRYVAGASGIVAQHRPRHRGRARSRGWNSNRWNRIQIIRAPEPSSKRKSLRNSSATWA